jgi:hypothetical protein
MDANTTECLTGSFVALPTQLANDQPKNSCIAGGTGLSPDSGAATALRITPLPAFRQRAPKITRVAGISSETSTSLLRSATPGHCGKGDSEARKYDVRAQRQSPLFTRRRQPRCVGLQPPAPCRRRSASSFQSPPQLRSSAPLRLVICASWLGGIGAPPLVTRFVFIVNGDA